MDSKLKVSEWLSGHEVLWLDGDDLSCKAQIAGSPHLRPSRSALSPTADACQETYCLSAGDSDSLDEQRLSYSVQRDFEIKAQLNPGTGAIKHSRGTLTYGELDNQADGLAALLQQNGVASGTACAICMRPSVTLVRTMLAVLKAGGAYLLLNPALPNEHTATMLHAFNPQILLAGEDEAGLLPQSDAYFLSCSEDGADLPSAWPQEYATDGQAPAYATCRPAAPATELTFISHSAVAQRLKAMQKQCPIGHGDSVLLHTDCTFKTVAWEFLWPLSNGAQLLLPSAGQTCDTDSMRELIRQERIVVIHANPVLLDRLFDRSLQKNLPKLRVVLYGAARSASDDASPAENFRPGSDKTGNK